MTARGMLATGAVAGVAVVAAIAQLQPGQTLGGFRVPEYEEDGSMRSQLFGDFARVLPNGLVEVEGVRVEMYRDGEVETRVASPHSLYDRQTRAVASTSSVSIIRGDVVITGDHYRYDPRNETFLIRTNARVVLRNSGRGLGAVPVPVRKQPDEAPRGAGDLP